MASSGNGSAGGGESGAHLTAQITSEGPAFVHIEPTYGGQAAHEDAHYNQSADRYEAVRTGGDRLPPAIDENQRHTYAGRMALPYESQGYMHVGTRDTGDNDVLAGYLEARKAAAEQASRRGDEKLLMEQQQQIGEPLGDFYTDQGFDDLVRGFRNEDGQFLAMTAYGAVPLPPQVLETVPEKLVSRPVVQERDVFVLKQDEKIRLAEQDYTQYRHRFVEVPKSVVVDQLEVKKDTRVIEIPRYDYQPVVEEKVVDLPLGIKYVEIPIEVECQAPPRIIPIAKPHIIERIIEKTKPVVQEKVIEVPEIIKKKVKKVVVKEIPYVVPKYVEKIIEVPYQPGQALPAPKGAPLMNVPQPPPLRGGEEGQGSPDPRMQRFEHGMDQRAQPRAAPPLPPRPGSEGGQSPSGRPKAEVRDDVLHVSPEAQGEGPQTFYVSPQMKNVALPYEAKIDVSIVKLDDVPPGVPIAQPHVRYMAPGSRAMAYNDQKQGPMGGGEGAPEPVYAGPMDPVIGHAEPGMRAVRFTARSAQPEILTQEGVVKYTDFECYLDKDGKKLMPKLPLHPLVPMDASGAPDLKKLVYMNVQQSQRMNEEIKKKTGRENEPLPDLRTPEDQAKSPPQ